MKQKVRRFILFIAFCILILILLSVDEVQGKKKRRHPPRREGKITRNEEQIERTKRRKAPKAKGMGPMSNITQEGDEPGTTTSSSSTTRTESRMEETIDMGNRKVTVDEQRVEKKASRQEKYERKNKQYMRSTTESASSTNTSTKDEIVTTSSTSSESPRMPDERKEDLGRSLRDPSGVEVHRIDEEDYGRTLAPGIEPSPPGFVNEEEFARHRATLATTTTTTTGATLVENIFAADIEGPRPIADGQNEVDNDIFLVVTPTTNAKMGIDSNRFWKFTRVPYLNNNSRIMPEDEREKKNRKEPQHPAGNNRPKNLRRGQIEIFVAKSEENAEGKKEPDTETTKCTKHRHQMMMETYTEKTTTPEYEMYTTEVRGFTTTTTIEGTEAATTITKDSESETTEMSPEGTTAGGTNLFISLLPDTPAQFDFDLDPSGNKTENAEKNDEKIEKGAQREPEKKNLEVVEEATTKEVSESEITQMMPLEPQNKDKNEGDCCALLRLLVGQKLNTTVGERSEFFTGTEDTAHSQVKNPETGGVASNKLVERVEDEHRKDDETASNSTVRAQWKIIESATTMKSGLEILSEDLREENVKLIRNHPESNEPTPVIEMTNTVNSTTPETVTHYRAQKGGPFPRSTTTLASTHKWTPYIFDCALESDERGERLCQEWAKGGLCEINRATQFLFCRRTCLCIGIQDETPRTRR